MNGSLATLLAGPSRPQPVSRITLGGHLKKCGSCGQQVSRTIPRSGGPADAFSRTDQARMNADYGSCADRVEILRGSPSQQGHTRRWLDFASRASQLS